MIGEEFLKSGQPQKSILPFKKATILNPYSFSAQSDLAEALLSLDKENEAFSSIKKGLSFNPSDLNLHKFLIRTLERKQRLEDIGSFSEEIADMIENPNSIPNFYFASAEALVHCEKFSQALLMYKKAFMENGPPVAYNQHYHYGLALYHEGRFEEALVQFGRVKELNPNVKQAWNSTAHINYCLGRVQKAKEEFEYIIQNGLEINSTHSNFLLVLLHLGESEEMINQSKERLGQLIASYRFSNFQSLYQKELKITKTILQRDDIDEKTREFNMKKLEGINFLLSFIFKK